MQHKSNKTIGFSAGKVDKKFTEERLTSYAGLSLFSTYVQAQGIPALLDKTFPTIKQSATKFSTTQIMLAIMYSSISDVH